MAHRVRVLLHLLRGQVFLLPLPHLIEAGEAMDVAEGVTLEALIEVGLAATGPRCRSSLAKSYTAWMVARNVAPGRMVTAMPSSFISSRLKRGDTPVWL